MLKHLLDNLIVIDKMEWSGLTVKPEKCRSLVIIKGEISGKTRSSMAKLSHP